MQNKGAEVKANKLNLRAFRSKQKGNNTPLKGDYIYFSLPLNNSDSLKFFLFLSVSLIIDNPE